jgi:hypothetical protein
MSYSNHQIYTYKGKEVPSVTTILQIINKPSLVYWSNWLGYQGLKYKEVLNDKADIGTRVHAAVEADIKKYLYIPIPYPNDEVIARYHRFLEFKDDNKFEPIFVEKSITSSEYGGTVDCYCKLNDKFTIIDWKTSKDFYPTMFIQLAAYRKLLHDNAYTVDQAAIVLLHEDKYKIKLLTLEELDIYYEIFNNAKELFQKIENANILNKFIEKD